MFILQNTRVNKMNVIDLLIENIIEKKNPTVVGLDPDLKLIPACYKENNNKKSNPFEAVADAIFDFNKDIIDTVYDLVPAVKPQIAFYEKYGSYGIKAFEDTVRYAKTKGLVVITDAKRNDIGNTAKAYAEAHLGTVELIDGSAAPSFASDFLTVSPFLGSESLEPFIDVCKEYGKGIFILVKTSNQTSGEIQDVITEAGISVSQSIADYISKKANTFVGEYGYSSIGAVVGATYPEEAVTLRKMMPNSYFLVPGYGVQGGGVDEIVHCFNSEGLGAIVNSSRGILFAHLSENERNICSRTDYLGSVRKAVQTMRIDIYNALKLNCTNIKY